MERPPIVTAEEWQQARDELLVAENALAARRRRLPMVPFDTGYTFDSPDGRKSLLELFAGHDQLVVYQFMDDGPEHYCSGCTWYTDNVPSTAPELLAGFGVSYVHVSNMPLAQIEKYRQRVGWTLPFLSSRGTNFSQDTGAGSGFSLSVFLRDSENVHLTYTTTSRGIDKLAFVNGILDLTPYGRQEEWEDSPPGWPQHPTAIMDRPMEFGMRATSFGRFR